jgi:hypothetical protein
MYVNLWLVLQAEVVSQMEIIAQNVDLKVLLQVLLIVIVKEPQQV